MKFYTILLICLFTAVVTAAKRPWSNRKSNSVRDRIEEIDNAPSFEQGEYTPEQLEMWRKSLVPLMWGANKVETPVPTFTIQGTIFCNGTGEPYLRPYLHYEGAPGTMIGKTITDSDGKFSITVTEKITDKKVVLVIRHVCPVEGLELPEQCGIPYFLTTDKFPEYAGVVDIHLHLNAMKNSTQPECHY